MWVFKKFWKAYSLNTPCADQFLDSYVSLRNNFADACTVP